MDEDKIGMLLFATDYYVKKFKKGKNQYWRMVYDKIKESFPDISDSELDFIKGRYKRNAIKVVERKDECKVVRKSRSPLLPTRTKDLIERQVTTLDRKIVKQTDYISPAALKYMETNNIKVV